MPISTYYKRPSKEDGEDNIGHCGCDPDNLAARLHTLATTRIMRSQRRGNEHLEQWYVEQTVDDANADDQLPLRHKHQPWRRLPQKLAPSARSNRPESSMKTHDKHCAVFLIKCPLANSVRLWGFIKNVNENLWVTKIVDSITVLQSQNSQTVKRKIRGLCCFFFYPVCRDFKHDLCLCSHLKYSLAGLLVSLHAMVDSTVKLESLVISSSGTWHPT